MTSKMKLRTNNKTMLFKEKIYQMKLMKMRKNMTRKNWTKEKKLMTMIVKRLAILMKMK
jgi:hypothetical protein